MISNTDYRKPFFISVMLHFFLIAMLLVDNSSSRPVLTPETKNASNTNQPIAAAPQNDIVKAVSVDSKQVMETVNRLKQKRETQKRTEINRQNELKRQAELARQQRIREQKQIARLKEEANKIAIARKKQVEEEKKHLKQLKKQKALEAQHIAELKKQSEALLKQQQLEAKKLDELNKKKIAEKVLADKLQKEKAEQTRLENEKKKQAAASAQAAIDAKEKTCIAGEVNKYKALIVNAISRNWILPENVDNSVSSQFRIRLAPDGMVLEVTLIRSSGDPLLDRSARTAIYKASPLPVPKDPETFNLFRDISLTVRPEQVRG